MELTPRTTSLTPPSVIDLTSSDGDPWLRLMERNPLIFQHLLNVTKHNLRTGSTNNRGIESGGAQSSISAPHIPNVHSRPPGTLRSPQTPEALLNTISPILTGIKRPASSPLTIERNSSFPLEKIQALRFPGKFKEPESRRLNHNQLDDNREGVSAKKKTSTRETTCILKNWLYEHRKNPYPTKEEKVMLAAITRMNLTQVSTWFANARRRLKKENQLNWSSKSRSISQTIQHQSPPLPQSILPPIFQPVSPIYWNGDQNLARVLGAQVQSMLFSQMVKDIRDRMGNRSEYEAKFKPKSLSPQSTSPAKIWSLADLVEEQPRMFRDVSGLKKNS